MQGTISIVKLTDSDNYRIIFYGTEMPEGLDPAAAHIARGVEGLGNFLDAIAVHADKQQAIKDALKIESSTNILNCSVPDDVLRRFGLT